MEIGSPAIIKKVTFQVMFQNLKQTNDNFDLERKVLWNYETFLLFNAGKSNFKKSCKLRLKKDFL